MWFVSFVWCVLFVLFRERTKQEQPADPLTLLPSAIGYRPYAIYSSLSPPSLTQRSHKTAVVVQCTAKAWPDALPDNVECVHSECPRCFIQKPLYF